MEPNFSADVKVTPARSPPASVTHSSEPFIRPSSSTTLPGTGSSAERHQPTSKAMISQQSSTTTKFPGTGSSASKHQPASQTKTSRPASSKGSTALTHQLSSQTKTDRPNLPPDTISDPSSHQSSHRPSFTGRPTPSDTADSASPVLHRSRQDSVSSFSSEAGSVLSDRPPLDLYTEEGELSEDPELSVMDQDQPVSDLPVMDQDQPVSDLPSPADLLHLTQQTLLHQSYTDLVRTVSQVFHQRPVVFCRTDPLLTCILRKESYLKIRNSLLWIKISRYQKNRPTGTPCRAFALIWAGPISRKLTVLPLQPKITPLLGPKLLLQVKSLSKCPQKNGCARNSPSST